MNRWRILTGDVRQRLAEIDDASVQTCITSPPYWGLRDYGTASWEGGDPSCQHRVSGQVQDSKAPSAITTGQRPGVDASRCRECGAIRRDCQIGLEKTPDAYVSELVAVFREVRRVLRDDGTLWLNLGDSYASNGGAHGGRDDNQTGVGAKRIHAAGAADQAPRRAADGLKPKDLVGIPWRVAFALQADGWWLRQDIIWHKPNPMPESVTDRCTKAHEYVFLLTKSARYYYDAEAVKEAFADERMGNPRGGGHYAREAFAHVSPHAQSGLQKGEWNTDGGKTGRNKRSVWTVSTSPYNGAHFAVMPEALVEPCVRAGCRTDDVVLDPFTGSGTVGAVALRLGRSFLGCELNPAYVALAEQRLRSVAPLFALEGA